MKPFNEQAGSRPEKTQPAQMKPSPPRMRAGAVVTLIGLFIFTVGARPSWFGWDRSPVVGFVQISVLLIGLGIICVGGYVGLGTLWKGMPRSIVADIGLRLVATGYVIAAFSGMADVFGMGSQPVPAVPYFGRLQATGVLIGQVIIAIGFVMLIPFHRSMR
jgi:xanthine/uracil permease